MILIQGHLVPIVIPNDVWSPFSVILNANTIPYSVVPSGGDKSIIVLNREHLDKIKAELDRTSLQYKHYVG